MIICEECGAHNRNDAYVCAVCEASLLHLEAIPDDEPAAAKRKITLFGLRNRRQEDYDEPEPASAAGEDIAVPADAVPDDTPYTEEPEEDGGLRFVFESVDEEIPQVESGDEPQELQMITQVAEEGEPEAASVAEDEQTVFSAPYDESPGDTIEIDVPDYAEAEEVPKYTETRSGRSREVHVRVARIRADRYQKAEEAVPSRMSADVDEDIGEPYDELDEPERMTRGMIAAIVTVASLLAVTLIVLGVILIGRGRTVPADASAMPPAVSEAAPAEAPVPSAEVTPVPIPTTNPE